MKKKSNRKVVNVFGKPYLVKYVEDPTLPGDEHQVAGYCDNKKCEILVSSKLQKEEMTQTTLHEEFHAVFHRVGINQSVGREIEEVIVDSLATFLVDNYKVTPK